MPEQIGCLASDLLRHFRLYRVSNLSSGLIYLFDLVDDVSNLLLLVVVVMRSVIRPLSTIRYDGAARSGRGVVAGS